MRVVLLATLILKLAFVPANNKENNMNAIRYIISLALFDLAAFVFPTDYLELEEDLEYESY